MNRSTAYRLILALAASLVLAGCGSSKLPDPPPSFTLSATPANPSVGQGGSATSTVTVVPLNGFTGSVSLSATGLPSGVTASFTPTSTATTSVMTLTASGTAAPGTATVTVTGTSGSLSPTIPVNLTIAAPSVTVTVSPVRAAVAATTQTQQFTATVTGNMGNANVDWSVDGNAGGNTTVGTISASGLYAAPATAGTHTITATSAALATSVASATVAVTDLAGVFTYHNDLSRDGANLQEYALTPSNVASATFGKLFSCAVDGAVYAQPLWVPGLSIGGGIHNVLFVATQHDSLYAFDADVNPCVTYWKVSLLDSMHGGTSGEVPVVWNDVGYCYGDLYPEVGVTGTPVIDPTTHTIYVVAASEIPGPNSGHCPLPQGTYYHRLHAIDLLTGSEKVNPPATIAASVPGTGDGSVGGSVSFDSQFHNNRSGLALAGGNVYVAFSAHEDATPYHGWLIAYDASTLQQVAAFNTTPNGLSGADGGIWAGGGAPAIDGGGDIYISTGNGIFDQTSSLSLENDYGDSLLRLHPFTGNTPNGANLNLVDFFTPDDQSCLASGDVDLGSGAPLLLPDQTSPGVPPHLLVQTGKEGYVYLINRDSMGQIEKNDCSGSNSQIVQIFVGAGGLWGTPAFWQNGLYYGGYGNPLTKFSFDTTTGLFNTSPASQSNNTFTFPTATPSISSQGATNGIAWAVDARLFGYAVGGGPCQFVPIPPACTGPAILHAYDASNLAIELWNSTLAAGNRDRAGNAVKFVPPTIANGKVYLSTRTEIDVYGLLGN